MNPDTWRRVDISLPVYTGCLEDEDYPETAVQIALYKETLMDKKYTEVPVDGDIVDYNYSRYSTSFSISHWESYPGQICPSQVENLQPLRLRNTEGKWRIILNYVQGYNQTVSPE
ncbi:uncharacterized protein LOC111703108 [Eurytemora carolleeae]|uniref:uncharacterized protein LOC111703108 n=1 Tax=Eurytemora carolleeae TaxID=1294199 RepID=UPI000C77EA7E|nr:uncharacterized protein LOC111703108 [Eurytemora carolleeae]|eukprot:XP_023330739.1 uncharacterized protein LOC111703108 [Eurytemora affinis]